MIAQCTNIDLLNLTTDRTGEKARKKHKRSSEPVDNSTQPKKVKTEHTPEVGVPSVAPVPRYIPVTNDPSGLFQIDSNPGDINDLLKRAEERERKRRKEAKRKHASRLHPEQVEVSDGAQDSDYQPSPTSDNSNEMFEKKVALRLKEKEEERRKKAIKKRKRESVTSVEGSDDSAENEPMQQPGKKHKAKSAVSEENGLNTFPKNTKRKKEKGKKKRSTEKTAQQQKPKKKKRKSA